MKKVANREPDNLSSYENCNVRKLHLSRHRTLIFNNFGAIPDGLPQ